MSTYIASKPDVKIPDKTALLAQGKWSHVDYNYVHYHIADAQMFELTEKVIPKIKAEWERLAYSMRYTLQDIKSFKKDSQDSAECCNNLLDNWISTGHGPN